MSSLSQELAERVQGMEKVANDCALLQVLFLFISSSSVLALIMIEGSF